VDFSFVRATVKHLYGSDGHESEDPIVIMKLMQLLFFGHISSERELMRIVGERMDYLWFLKMDLDDTVGTIANRFHPTKCWHECAAVVFKRSLIELFVEH